MEYEAESQLPFRCRLEWGHEGASRAADRQDVVAIVDTLRFSTTASVVVAHGAIVRMMERREAPVAGDGGDILSPGRYEDVSPGAHVALWSLNGAMCCRGARDASRLFVASLINARAAAEAITAVAREERGVSVVACGERRMQAHGDGPLRFALEDYLGAGAILSYLRGSKSPEARVCQAAFEASREDLPALLLDSTSGRELRQKGLAADVKYAARLNLLDTVPVLEGEELRAFQPELER